MHTSVRSDGDALTCAAPAKINLGLHILRRREDGYHDIETVMLPIPWFDRLSVRDADTLRLTCTDSTLPTDERNLVVQAAQRLAGAAGIEARGHLHLAKYIPYGTGLGGGSSDAAATLMLLRDYWQLSLSDETLQELAAELGSDVPFFLLDGAVHATGRGVRLESFEYRCPYWAVVVVPPVRISTAEAYGLVTPRDVNRPDLPALVASNDLERWRSELVNDFEPAIFERYPAVADLKADLLEYGAGYASMTGSGSAVYALFEGEDAAGRAARVLEGRGRVWMGLLAGSTETV